MIESGQVPEKVIESRQVLEESGRVPEEGSNLDEYRKRDRIRANTRKVIESG